MSGGVHTMQAMVGTPGWMHENVASSPRAMLPIRPLLGRQAERDALVAALADTERGRGSVWLLVGEAGIGKSRLAEELAREAEARGALVAWGRAWESGGAPAFWPWIQVLRTVMRRRGAEACDARRSVVLAQLLPELGDATEQAPTLVPEQARFRLLDAAVSLLLDAAEVGPLCIVLEDLHVADPSSLLLLELLAAQVRAAPLLVIGTHRDVTSQTSAQAAALGALARDTKVIALHRLGADEVLAYLSAVLPRPPDAVMSDAVAKASEGNPLFVVELARWLASGTHARVEPGVVPATLRSIIADRLAGCHAQSVEILRIASVLGREFSRPMLTTIAGVDHDAIERAMAHGVANAIVDPVGFDRYRFSHVLVRDALYSDLPTPQRCALHLEGADACLALSSDSEPPWSELAHHLLLAGREHAERAIEAAVCAAERATNQLAFDEAVDWLARALAHVELLELPEAQALDERRTELLLALGRARIVAGDIAGGRRNCCEAAALARRHGDALLFARAALEHGSVFLFAQVSDELVGLLREALALLGEREPALRARLQARLAAALQPAPDPSMPIALAEEATALARTCGDSTVLLDVLRSAGSALADLADPAQRRLLDREHLALAERLGDDGEALRASMRLLFDALESGDATEAITTVVCIERYAEQLDVPHASWRAQAARAVWSWFTGHFDAAAAAWQRATALGEQARDPNARRSLLLQRTLSARLLGDDDLALQTWPRLREAMLQQHHHGAQFLLAYEHILLGRHARATPKSIEHVLDDLLGLDDLAVCCSLLELAFANADTQLARRLEPELARHARTFVNWGMTGMYVGEPHALWQGRLQSFLGDVEAAEANFAAAMDACERTGAVAFCPWITLHHARHLLRHRPDRREQHRELLERTLTTAADLGMRALVRTVEQEAGFTLDARTTHASTPLHADLVASTATASEPTALPKARPTAPATAELVETELRLQRLGDVWELRGDGEIVHIRDTKGVRMLAKLLSMPGRAIHVLELGDDEGDGEVVDVGDAGPMIDEHARHAYRDRILELRSEIAEAEQWHDTARTERLQHELEALEHELARSVGLGKRLRRAGSNSERARVNVQRRLKDVIRRIEAQRPELARRLDRGLRTGTHCSYEP